MSMYVIIVINLLTGIFFTRTNGMLLVAQMPTLCVGIWHFLHALMGCFSISKKKKKVEHLQNILIEKEAGSSSTLVILQGVDTAAVSTP